MNNNDIPVNDKKIINHVIEAAIRLGIVLLLLIWCFQIIQPFIIPVLWGAIIAIAIFPVFNRFERLIGRQGSFAAFLFTLICLFVLAVPMFLLIETLVEGLHGLAKEFQDGVLKIPPPPRQVAGWPIIGKPLNEIWTMASTNLEAVAIHFESQLKQLGKWLFSAVAGAGLGLLQFIFSIVISGIFLAKNTGCANAMREINTRLTGDRGANFVQMSSAIIRSVAQGVLGVAIIQAILGGLGLLAVDVPGAGLWTLIVLFLAVMQLPPLLILGPIVIYVFSTSDTLVATIFAVWSILVSISDSFLKPLLLGRGLKTPMIVILLGAIGGMLASGIIGLFVGAVVLALTYELFLLWLEEGEDNSKIK